MSGAGAIRCPCGNRVIQKSTDGRLRIRTKIVSIDSDGRAEVVCRSCGRDLVIDLRAGDSLKKALDGPAPRLVLRAVKAKTLDPGGDGPLA